jgi:hypothetical protein
MDLTLLAKAEQLADDVSRLALGVNAACRGIDRLSQQRNDLLDAARALLPTHVEGALTYDIHRSAIDRLRAAVTDAEKDARP